MKRNTKIALLGSTLGAAAAIGAVIYSLDFYSFSIAMKIEKNFMETKSKRCPYGEYFMGECRKKGKDIIELLSTLIKPIEISTI